MSKKEKAKRANTDTATRFFTFGTFDEACNPVKVYAGAVMSYVQASKRCEVLQKRHSNSSISFC